MSVPHHPRLSIAIAIVCFAVAGLVVWGAGVPSRATHITLGQLNGQRIAPEVGALAPPFSLPDPTGVLVTLDIPQTGARVTLVNFWATWCAPCEAEMPILQALYDAHHARGLRVIGVNLAETPEQVTGWAERLGLAFALPIDGDGRTAADYRLRGQPTTVIVASDGRIVAIVYGAADRATLERFILPLLSTES
jgi:thiol-disulfide isomerase/thioredoxin